MTYLTKIRVFSLTRIPCFMLALTLMVFSAPRAAMAAQDLVFLVDGSGSIDATDFRIQKDGIVLALNDEMIVPRDGSIAIAVVQFGDSTTRVEVDYTIIQTPANVASIVGQVGGIVQIGSATNPGDAINRATSILSPNARTEATQEYCLSTDGLPNSGASVSAALNNAKNTDFVLDRFGVIAIEDPPFFFADDFQSFYGPLAFEPNGQSGTVLVVRNATEFANLLGTACLPPELELVGLEVNQSVQDLENGVKPLVENKPTLVRAYIQPKGMDPEKVQARLKGTRGGAELPGSPITPTNDDGAIDASPGAFERRADINESLNFELPKSWLNGTVELTVEPVGGLLDCQEFVGPQQFDCSVTVNFEPSSVLKAKLFRVKWVDSFGAIFQPSSSDLSDYERRLLAMYPLAKIDRQTGGSIDMGQGKPTPFGVNIRLALIRLLDLCDPFTCERIYYGAMRTTGFSGVIGQARILTPLSSGFINDGDAVGRNTHAHEIGHNLGLPHTVNDVPFPFISAIGPCGSLAFPFTPFFPNIETVSGIPGQVATIGPLSQGEEKIVFGFDSDRGIIIDPTVHFALMSYCGFNNFKSQWVSDINYERLRTRINSTFGASGATAAGSSEFLIIRGNVNFDTNEVAFQDFATLESAQQPSLPPVGDYVLRLEDGAGNVIDQISFEPDEDAPLLEDPANHPPRRGGFIIGVPKNPSIARVVVLLNGVELNSVSISQGAPSVQVLSPNGGEVLSGDTVRFEWTGGDADGDPLTYIIQYSPDGGGTWETLTVDHPEQFLDVDLEFLRGTQDGLIRVQATDGFNTATDTSDSAFTVPNVPPEVSIIQPRKNQAFVGVQLLTFRAFLRDLEDGDVPDSNLAWASNIDGFIGNGNHLTKIASDFSVGVHVIQATVTDSAGAQSTDSVTVRVSRLPVGAAVLLVLDDEAIDNGTSCSDAGFATGPGCVSIVECALGACPGVAGPPVFSDPAVLVNDDIASIPGVAGGCQQILKINTVAEFAGPQNPMPFITLPTGETGDGGLFSPAPNVFTGVAGGLPGYVACADAQTEDLLDGIAQAPLDAADITALEGRRVCAVVHDSDISDLGGGQVNAQGARNGRTAFHVNRVVPHPDGGSALPVLEVAFLEASAVDAVCACENLVTLAGAAFDCTP